MPEDDILTKVYQDIEAAANRASTAVKNLIGNTDKLKSASSSIKSAGSVAMGALNPAFSAIELGSGLASGNGIGAAYKEFYTDVKTNEYTFKAAGKTMELFSKTFVDSSTKLGGALKSTGGFISDFGNQAKFMDDAIKGLAGRSDLFSKSFSGLAKVMKVGLGEIGFAVTATVAVYETFISRSMELSDKLIAKQKEVASSFKATMSFAKDTSEGIKSGQAYTQTASTAQALYMMGLPGGRQTALAGMGQGASLGMGIDVSAQITNLASQIAQAQGKALEPVLKEVFSKANFAFIGKNKEEQQKLIREQQLIMGTSGLAYGPSAGDAYTNSLERAGAGFGRGRRAVGNVSRSLQQAFAHPSYQYEDNPILSAFINPFRQLGSKASEAGGKFTEGIMSPLVAFGNYAGDVGNAGQGILGAIIGDVGKRAFRGEGNKHLEQIGQRLTLGASGQREQKKAEGLTGEIAELTKKIKLDDIRKDYRELGIKATEAEKIKEESLKNIDNLDIKLMAMSPSDPEYDKTLKEFEENASKIRSSEDTIAKYRQAQNRGRDTLIEGPMAEEERKGIERALDYKSKQASRLFTKADAKLGLLSKPKMYGLELEQASDLGTLSAEYGAAQLDYAENIKEMQKLERKRATGRLTMGPGGEEERLSELQSQTKGFEGRWVTAQNQEKFEEYKKEVQKYEEMLSTPGIKTKDLGEQKKKVLQLEKDADLKTAGQDIGEQEKNAFMLVRARMGALEKSENIASMQTSLKRFESLGMEGGALDKAKELIGDYDIEGIKKAFYSKDVDELSELTKGNIQKEDLQKLVDSGDLPKLMTRGLRITPGAIEEAQGYMGIAGQEYQRKQMEMESRYLPQQREFQGKVTEYSVKELQDIGRITEEEIQKITELLAKKDQLSVQEGQKILEITKNKYQLEEATLNLTMKGVKREGEKGTLATSIQGASRLGYIGAGEAKRLSGITANLDNVGFEKASPVIQNILSIQEKMYQQELQFTVKYTEARMNIIKEHYDKVISLEKLSVEGPDRRMAPFVQYGQGIVNAYQPQLAAQSGRIGIINQAREQAMTARGLQEGRIDLGLQLSGVGVPEYIQQGRAIRAQREAEENFRRQKTQEAATDRGSLDVYKGVLGRLGEKGVGFEQLAQTEGGRGMLQNLLLQNQGAFARQHGYDVTPTIQGLVGKQLEFEGKKVDMELFERKAMTSMYGEQIGAMEDELGKLKPGMRTEAAFPLASKYGEAAEYYKSIGETDKYKEAKEKQMAISKELPGYLQNVKDAGQAAMVQELKNSNRLLETIASATSKMAGISNPNVVGENKSPEVIGQKNYSGVPEPGSGMALGSGDWNASPYLSQQDRDYFDTMSVMINQPLAGTTPESAGLKAGDFPKSLPIDVGKGKGPFDESKEAAAQIDYINKMNMVAERFEKATITVKVERDGSPGKYEVNYGKGA